MTPLRRQLLRLEVGICFLPLALQLILGLVVAPLQFVFLVTGEGKAKLGALLVLSLIAVAMCGFTALHSVMTWLLHGRRTSIKPRTVVILAGTGLLLLVSLIPTINGFVAALVVVPPLLCSIHLIWLARDYFSNAPAAPVSANSSESRSAGFDA